MANRPLGMSIGYLIHGRLGLKTSFWLQSGISDQQFAECLTRRLGYPRDPHVFKKIRECTPRGASDRHRGTDLEETSTVETCINAEHRNVSFPIVTELPNAQSASNNWLVYIRELEYG